MIGESKREIEGDVLKSPLHRSSSLVCCTKPGVAREIPVDVGPGGVGGKEEGDIERGGAVVGGLNLWVVKLQRG